MTNKYQIKDQIGRDIFSNFCKNSNQRWCKYVTDAKDDYSVWDVAYLSGFTSNNNKVQVLGEIKRRTNYESTSFSSWILEVDKLESLQAIRTRAKTKGKDVKLTYINIFKDNITRIWNITNLDLNDYEIKLCQLPKNDFDSTLVFKKVIYLDNIDAEPYETDEKLSIFKNLDYNNEEELPF